MFGGFPKSEKGAGFNIGFGFMAEAPQYIYYPHSLYFSSFFKKHLGCCLLQNQLQSA